MSARHHTGYSSTPQVGVKVSKVEFSNHMLTQAATKGFTKEQILQALTRPYKVTDVTEHPGQRRFCGKTIDGVPGVAVVLAPLGGGHWRAVTVYLDGVRTALRPDQMSDPRALASRRVGIR